MINYFLLSCQFLNSFLEFLRNTTKTTFKYPLKDPDKSVVILLMEVQVIVSFRCAEEVSTKVPVKIL